MLFNTLPPFLMRQMAQNPIDSAFYKQLKKEYMTPICPFEVILGFTNTTETGYKPAQSVPTDYTSFTKTQNGKEASIVTWKNSYKITQDSTRPDGKKNRGIKTWQVGDVYWGVFLEDRLNDNYVPYSGNQGFISLQFVQQVTLRLYNIELNKKFFENLEVTEQQYYVLPTGLNQQTATQKANPYEDTDRQFFFIQNSNVVRDINNRIVYIDCNFLTFSNNIKDTGLTVASFLQLGGAGEPYAFPALLKNSGGGVTVTLDTDRLKARPVTGFQVLFYGNVEFVGYNFRGRPLYKDDITDIKKYYINQPSAIGWQNFQGCVADTLNLRKSPETTFYPAWSTYSIISSRTLGQQLQTLQNRFGERQIEGLIQSDYNKIHGSSGTNPNLYPYWDSRFCDDASTIWTYNSHAVFPIDGNDMFEFVYNNQKVTPNSTFTKSKFTYKDVPATQTKNFKNLANFLFINGALFKTVYQLPITLDFNTPIAYSRFPIFGKVWNVFTLGLDTGYSKNNINIPKMGLIPSLKVAGLYDTYTNALFRNNRYAYSGTGTKWVFDQLLGDLGHDGKQGQLALGDYPFEVLTDDVTNTLTQLVGGNATTVGIAGNLSNIAEMDAFNSDGTLNSHNIIDMSEIGQEISHVGWHLLNENFNLLPRETQPTVGTGSGTRKDIIGYAMDIVNFTTVGIADYQIKFFSQASEGNNQAFDDKDCVYIAKLQTTSKGANTMKAWQSVYKLSNPEFKFNKPFQYPKDLPPIPPTHVKQYTIDLENVTSQFIEGTKGYITFNNEELMKLTENNIEYSEATNQIIIPNVPAPATDYKLSRMTADLQIQIGAKTKRMVWNDSTYNNKTILISLSETNTVNLNIQVNESLIVNGIKVGDGNYYEDMEWESTEIGNTYGRYAFKFPYTTTNANVNLNYDISKEQLILKLNNFPFFTEAGSMVSGWQADVDNNYIFIKSEGTSQYLRVAKVFLTNIKAIYLK